MSKVRGSYYVDGRRGMTLTTTDEDKLVDVGFRLVHDGAGQRDRGGVWDGHPDSVASARSWEDRPYNCLDVLGIRLVWDRP